MGAGIIIVLVWAALMCVPSACRAADVCPWLNNATASGIFGGRVSSATVERGQTGDDAKCSFVRHEGALAMELRIEVETMRDLSKNPYGERCHSATAPLPAIGNKAVACSDGPLAELVVGRVRDRAFAVRLSTNERGTAAGVLREEARKIAEQVAGILF